MPSPEPSNAQTLRPIAGFQPTTFLERGIVVPFTTPALVGARVRPAPRRGHELIVANPAKVRGVYIVQWEGVHGLCSPTQHDRYLNAKLDGLGIVTPGGLRRVACETAAEGLAGRDAIAPAKAMLQTLEDERVLATFELLLEVVRSVEGRDPSWVPPGLTQRSQLEIRARNALAKLAPAVGRAPEDLMSMLEELAVVFSGVGVGRQAATARLTLGMAQIDELRRQMRLWQRACGDGGSPLAALVDRTAELTVAIAKATLHEARALLTDLSALFRRWANEPDTVLQLTSRTDWLLNGWERICLLWQTVDETFNRLAALSEMVELIPVVPREVTSWVDMDVDGRLELLRRRRRVSAAEDWRTGITAADLVARNERMRAISPAGPC